jgi:hypothetical protein
VEKWRLSNNPHDTPPFPLIPSPTFAHSSLSSRQVLFDVVSP